MKKAHLGLSLLLLFAAGGQSSAQDAPAGAEACLVKLPGISFSRSLNGAAGHVTLDGGTLKLASGPKSDYFRDPDGTLAIGNAPVLLAPIDNTQPFTLTARITPTFRQTYDAGTLYVYLDEKRWLKFALEMDERHKTRIVTVRTLGTSDDNNHDVVSQAFVHLKITSDTKVIGFYYSLDDKTWQLVRLFRNDYPASIWVGISSQSPMGEGSSTTFEGVSLNHKSVADFRLGL